MNNKSYFQPIEDYFEQITKSTTKIGNFVPMSDGALDDILSNKPIFPLLCLVDYEGKLNQNKQRTIATRTVTFSILFRCPTDKKTDQREKVNEAEMIGLNILSKIEFDSCSGNNSWLKNAFKKESVHFSKIEYMSYNDLHGAEFSFDLDIKNPLNYDNEFWDIKN